MKDAKASMTIEFDFEVLSSLGLTAALASRALQQASDVPPDARLMRVVEVHRETLVLHDGHATHRARPLPRFTRALAEQDTAVAVGDWVVAGRDAHGDGWVEARVPPCSHIVRRDGDGRRHPVVSNVDTALLVMGLDDDFNPRRLERYLALAHGDGVVPVVVLTKARHRGADGRGARRQARAACAARCRRTLDVWRSTRRTRRRRRRSRGYCGRGQTLVLLGSSGAGKSTLTNTLLGAAVQDTGAVRAHDSRGKHTTTARSLHRLPGGACVIDTPGLRALRPDGDAATRRRRLRAMSRRSPRSAAFAIAGTSRSRGAPCAKASARIACATTTSCCARCGATR